MPVSTAWFMHIKSNFDLHEICIVPTLVLISCICVFPWPCLLALLPPGRLVKAECVCVEAGYAPILAEWNDECRHGLHSASVLWLHDVCVCPLPVLSLSSPCPPTSAQSSCGPLKGVFPASVACSGALGLWKAPWDLTNRACTENWKLNWIKARGKIKHLKHDLTDVQDRKAR